jgi:hypothetical protein
LNWGHFVVVFLVLFCFSLVWFGLAFFPLWWDNSRTASETPSPGLKAEGLTPKLFRLKLYCIWTWRFLIFFYLIFIFLILFFSQSSLCLSNAWSAYCWLVHSFSLFISLKLLFVCFGFFCLFVFPSLTSLLSLSSHPSILNITIVSITS